MPKNNKEAEQTEALAPTGPTAITTITDLSQLSDIDAVQMRPESLSRDDLTGTENIDPNSIRLPRLAIAQSLTPQFIEGDAQRIPGLGMFDMFNDVTDEVYGRGPLKFVPIRFDERRIEFRPRNEGGGIVDLDVPYDDPRLEWTPATATTLRIPPRATTFFEYVILLLRPGHAPEPLVLSIKMTNKHFRKGAENLKTYIKLRSAAIYSGLYTVDTKVPAKNDKGTWGVHNIKNAGFIPLDTVAGAALFKFAEEFEKSLRGKDVAPKHREEPTPMDHEGDASFDPATLEDRTVNAGM